MIMSKDIVVSEIIICVLFILSSNLYLMPPIYASDTRIHRFSYLSDQQCFLTYGSFQGSHFLLSSNWLHKVSNHLQTKDLRIRVLGEFISIFINESLLMLWEFVFAFRVSTSFLFNNMVLQQWVHHICII